MKPRSLYIISALTGIILGILSNHFFLAGTWWSLVVWGIVGAVVGFYCRDSREKVRAGILYGFFLTVSFLVSSFGGTPNKIPVFAIFTVLLSVIGALGGLISTFVGGWAKKQFS